MKNHVDKYGLYNVKPVRSNGEPTGNDGWIITAYAKKAGLPVDHVLIEETWASLEMNEAGIPKQRYPGKVTPYPSRDMVIALKYLRLASPTLLIHNDWKFNPMPLPGFDLFKLTNQAFQHLPHWRDRNYFWENNLDQFYRFAFSVPLVDRYWILLNSPREVPPLLGLIGMVHESMSSSDNSGKLLRWLKYDQFPGIKCFEEYFGLKHPITIKIKEDYAKQPS